MIRPKGGTFLASKSLRRGENQYKIGSAITPPPPKKKKKKQFGFNISEVRVNCPPYFAEGEKILAFFHQKDLFFSIGKKEGGLTLFFQILVGRGGS